LAGLTKVPVESALAIALRANVVVDLFADVVRLFVLVIRAAIIGISPV
jgi:hypothetical protein